MADSENSTEGEKDTISAFEELFGILSDKEAEELKRIIKENRRKTTESVRRRAEEKFESRLN